MRIISILFAAILLFFVPLAAFSQVTSSSLAGVVLDESNKPMEGAIVEATHVPSGTKYGSATKSDGSFHIEGMRVGGPYTVQISFGGSVIRSYENIELQLGETYQLSIKLGGATQQLTGITITTTRDNVFNSQHTGATTIITSEQMENFPTLSRNALDITALTPQANGTDFEGRNSLYNNVQINGANFNNAFGLSSGFSGGGMPIPLDAVKQIQVAISDFDLRQSDFTGANINLVTKSGTNEISGSAYTYYRDQSFNGMHVGSTNLPAATKSTNQVYGASLGGPIIKNKLFFFVNGEYEQDVSPALSPYWVAATPGATGADISRPSATELQQISQYVKSTYGYNTGAYPGAAGYNNDFADAYTRFLARLDYNLNDKNKIDASYSYYHASLPSLANSTSAANGSLSYARNGQYSLAYANTDYNTVHTVNAASVEWVSTITDNISNQLLASVTETRDTRSSPSSMFPFVDIFDLATQTNTASLGYELFTYKNDVKQSNKAIYDNLTIHAGINTITAGASYQYLTFANSYLPYGTSYYRYASVQDFLENEAPIGFGYTYAYAGQDGYAKVNYGLPGAYVQDRVNLLQNKLTLSGGVRMDMPLYLDKIPNNPYIDTLNLLNPNSAYNNGYGTAYHTTHYNASAWPNEKPVIQPRVGFNWSPLENRKLQVRGGTGIFMGQVPFVWFTNAPANNGVVSNNVQIDQAAVLQYLKFQPNAQAAINELPAALQAEYFPQQAGSSVPSQIAAVAPNFQMPRIWRSDLAADYKLPWLGLIGTVELMYTKDIYSVYYFNANQPNPTGDLADSGDHRPIYPGNKIYSNISGAYILANSTQGYSYSETIGISRPVQKGFYGSVYYTHMLSEEVSPMPGSQASSAWEDFDYLNNPNDQMLGRSNYFAPNRVVASMSYRYEYAKHFASTLSLYYNGSTPGNFDFTYDYDVNGISNIYGQLIYIPKSAQQLNWAPIAGFTVAQEEAAFNQFLDQDKYLNSHRGQYMARNGEAYPWYNGLNLKFAEDIYDKIGKRKHTLQFTVDIINFPNLIDKNWGLEKMLTVDYGSLLYGFTNSTGVTTYKMATIVNSQGQTVLPTSTFMNDVTPGSTWSMQLGLKYSF